ncbi:MAG: hypothetical protein H7196_03655 [candidate division SR1 bacterium]|nr:hypothetical protein [candidate division SR1 bacterium]
MRNFLHRVWINARRFFKWVSNQKFTKIALRELLSFIIAFFLVLRFLHLEFFVYFSTFLGAYLISLLTVEWVLTIGKRKNDILTWVSRGFTLFIIYQAGLSVVNNIMPKPHDIHYYYAGFIAGILGYLVSTATKKIK